MADGEGHTFALLAMGSLVPLQPPPLSKPLGGSMTPKHGLRYPGQPLGGGLPSSGTYFGQGLYMTSNSYTKRKNPPKTDEITQKMTGMTSKRM